MISLRIIPNIMHQNISARDMFIVIIFLVLGYWFFIVFRLGKKRSVYVITSDQLTYHSVPNDFLSPKMTLKWLFCINMLPYFVNRTHRILLILMKNVSVQQSRLSDLIHTLLRVIIYIFFHSVEIPFLSLKMTLKWLFRINMLPYFVNPTHRILLIQIKNLSVQKSRLSDLFIPS